jgi:hypothetical protein
LCYKNWLEGEENLASSRSLPTIAIPTLAGDVVGGAR